VVWLASVLATPVDLLLACRLRFAWVTAAASAAVVRACGAINLCYGLFDVVFVPDQAGEKRAQP
jgi:hypothetical protein